MNARPRDMTPSSSVDPVPATFAREVRKHLQAHLKEIRLFGSRARGDARKDSDYDMLVIVDTRSPEIRDTILDIEAGLLERYDALVASILRTEDEWQQRQGRPLARAIERESQLL